MDPTTQQWPETKRFTVDEVQRMEEAGIFDTDEHYELLDGELVRMTRQGAPHLRMTVVIHRLLEQAFGPGFHVQDHSNVIAGTHHMPEPDLAVVKGDPRDYLTRHVTGADVAMVVEVCHTTHTRDHRKARIYAEGGFAHYWIVDLEARRIELHAQPTAKGYARVDIIAEDGCVEIPSPTPCTVAAAELLP